MFMETEHTGQQNLFLSGWFSTLFCSSLVNSGAAEQGVGHTGIIPGQDLGTGDSILSMILINGARALWWTCHLVTSIWGRSLPRTSGKHYHQCHRNLSFSKAIRILNHFSPNVTLVLTGAGSRCAWSQAVYRPNTLSHRASPALSLLQRHWSWHTKSCGWKHRPGLLDYHSAQSPVSPTIPSFAAGRSGRSRGIPWHQ